jgi:RecA/RadA recombinase
MGKPFSFDELDKQMTKIDPLGSIITENEFSKIDDWISTGNYLLNAQVSGSIFKGTPNSRSIVFSGVSGTGKTFVILNSVREAQKKGYYVIYGDSEAAVDEDIMVKFGIDPTKVRYQPLKTVLQTRHFITNLCATLKEKKKGGFDIPKIAMVIDSLGNLATDKEIGDAMSGSDKRDMTKQQNLKSMFRVITTDLAELKIPLFVANHVYAAIGSYFPQNVQSGGSGAIYNASIIVEFHKAGLKDGDNDASQINSKSGIVVTSKVVKSRFARPIPIKFHISFFKGMNPYVGLENYVTWENCGIGRGELVEEILETPIFEADGVTPKMYRGKPKIERTKTGNVTYKADPKATTFAVKHLGKTVKGSEVFTSAVFTDEILQMLDEKVIRPIFELPKVVSDENDLEEELFGETDSFNEEVPTEIQEQVQGLAETLASKHEDNENDN